VTTPEKKVPLGPTGLQVQHNVKRLREAKGLTYTELSARLSALGRPIPVLGLRRIEAGERRVDADDLIALARVLGVPPVLLLLPLGHLAMAELLPGELVPTWAAVKWFAGEAAFPDPDLITGMSPLAGTAEDNQAWATGATPVMFHRDHDRVFTDWLQTAERADIVRASKATTKAERDERAVRLREVEQQVREVEQALGDLRARMRLHGIVPPRLPVELRHLDPIDKPRSPRRKKA
jgi:transcriptional regulator with XRE-family HTH domain